MKIRKMLTMLLVLAMVCALLPATALAVTQTVVYVGDTNVTTGYETARSLYGGTVQYRGGVLTLNNVTVTSSYEFDDPHLTGRKCRAAIYADGDLTITLQNANSVTGSNADRCSYGVCVNGRLTVSADSTGMLTATSGSAAEGAYGVHAADGIAVLGGKLTGIGGDMTASGSSYGVHALENATGGIEVKTGGSLIGRGGRAAYNSYGVRVSYLSSIDSATITVSGGTLTGTASDSGYSNYGVSADCSITVTSGTLTGTGGNVTSSGNSYGVYAFQTITLTGGTTIAKSGSVTGTGSTQAIHLREPEQLLFKDTTQPNEYWYQWRTSVSGDCTSSDSTSNPIVKYELADSAPFDTYVEFSPTGARYFTTQPLSQSVTEGQTATFSVTATGNPAPSYQWKVSTDGGTSWNNVSDGTDGTSASYTTPATTMAMSGYQYCCYMENTVDNITSNEVTLTITAAPSGGDDDYTPPSSATVYNDPSVPNATIWLTGSGLPANDLLMTDRLSSGSDYNALLRLADAEDVFRVYNIRLQSGKSATGSAMYLHFDLAASYAGQTFTLVHKLADGTYEYFYATADANGDLVFGPLDSLSPFMLAKGTLSRAAVVNVPQTGDSSMPGLWMGAGMLGLLAVGLAYGMKKRKQAGM